MTTYYKDWKNEGTYIVPPIPYSKYPEPLDAQQTDSADENQYDGMRTQQKSEIDEGTVYRRLYKFASEHCRSMFIFHSFCFKERERAAFLDTFGQNTVKQAIDKLKDGNVLNEMLDKNDTLRYLEMDFLVVDKQVGLIAIEVKGNQSSQQRSDDKNIKEKITKAKEQLQKDAELLRLIGYLSDSDENWERKLYKWKNMPIRKVVAMADDDEPARPRDEKKSVVVVFRNQLKSVKEFQQWWNDKIVRCLKESWGQFQQWWHANVEGPAPPNSADIYKHLVPVLVGLSAAFNTPDLLSIDDLHERDVQIASQNLSSRSSLMELLINVHKNEAELKDFVLKYLTLDQKKCLNSDKICIIEGAAGAGKTLVMMLKLLEVARQKPPSSGQEQQTLLLCNGPFVQKYFDFLANNKIRAKIYRSHDEVKDLFSLDNALYISIKRQYNYIGKSPKPYQVVLCQLYQFLSAAHQKWDEIRLTKQNFESPKLKWNQTLNVFIDDADPKIFLKHKWDGLLTEMDPRFYTWIALDHTQTWSQHWDSSEAKEAKALLTTLRQLGGTWWKLKEVLRNSVEIIELNEKLAKYIATFHHVQNAPMPAVGHNRVSGPIQLMELYDRNLYDAKLWQVEEGDVEKECDRALAKFLEFVLTNVVLPNADRCRTAVLTVGGASFATTFRSHLKDHPNFGQLKELLVYADHCRNFSELVVRNPENTRSFEWEQVVVVIAPQPGLLRDDWQEAQRSEFWYNLYLATTRARTRLYLVGPPVIWDVFLKPLGVYELYFLRFCYISKDQGHAEEKYVLPTKRKKEKDTEEDKKDEVMPNRGSYKQVSLPRSDDELLTFRKVLEKKYRVPGPVQLMELNDATFWSANASEEVHWEALAKFVMFLLEKKYVSNVDSSQTTVLTFGDTNTSCNTFWKYLRHVQNIGQLAQLFRAERGGDLQELWNYLNKQSFEWEPLLVVILPQRLQGAQLLQEMQRLEFWYKLYDAQTQFRTRLYVVGPPVVWEVFLKPLELPKQFVQRRCFEPDQQVPGSYKQLEEEQ